MLFTSSEFLVFFLVVFGLYYLPPLGRWQVPLLVAASLCFYAWHTPMLLILLTISIAINAVGSFQIARRPLNQALWWGIGCVVANLSMLGLFKYGALVAGLLADALALPTGPESALSLILHLPLPIGISFYTFEGISLVADVLKRRKKAVPGKADPELALIVHPSPTQHFLRTSLFVAFFPHLIAGPILKASHFFPQIGRKYFRDIAWAPPIETLIIGYFLKLVVADNLKDFTFWIGYPFYQTLSPLTGVVLLFGYSIQIFADFAGYSLIAMGLGRLLGYDLINNFNFPYISRSLSEFWRRWHISLSTWLRDYLYIPLGGNRFGEARTYVNLMVVMTLGGLWHGAAWSYAVWGVYHGAGLALERWVMQWPFVKKASATPRTGWPRLFTDGFLTLYVFGFVTLGWLLFKLPNGSQAADFLITLASNRQNPFDSSRCAAVLLFSLPVVIYHLVHYPDSPFEALQRHRWWPALRQVSVGIALVFIILNSGSATDFIYFQF